MANSDREVLVSIPLSKEAIKSFSEFGASRNKKKQLLHWFLEKTGFGKSLIFQRLVPKKGNNDEKTFYRSYRLSASGYCL